jgi:AraC-like DNA-binding protein
MSSAETGAGYLLNLSLRSPESKYVWTKSECEANGISKIISRLEKESMENTYCSDISMKIAAAELILTLLRDTQNDSAKSLAYDKSHENLAKRIYNSIVYINKNYSNDITAEETAKLVFMSYSYFSRSFKKVTGMTFKNYLNRTRISKAEQLLFESGGSISETAIACGYNSISYFISIYKRYKGKTPLTERKSGKASKE